MSALVDSIFISLEKEYPHFKGHWFLRYLLYLIGLSLAMVGLFPFDGSGIQPIFHNHFAETLVLMVIIIMFGNP